MNKDTVYEYRPNLNLIKEYNDRKLTKEEIQTLPIELIYEIVRGGRTYKNFPKGTWQRPDNKTNACKLVKYIVEQNKITNELLYENGTGEALKIGNIKIPIYVLEEFEYGIASIFEEALDNFKIYRLNRTPKGYWLKPGNIVEALNYFMERDKVKSVYDITTHNIVKDWGMKEAKLIYGGVHRLVEVAFPDTIIYKFNCHHFTSKDITPQFCRGLLEYYMKESNTTLEQINNEWLRKNNCRVLENRLGTISNILNYCYETDKFEPAILKYPKEKVFNMLRDYLGEEPTEELVVKIPVNYFIKMLAAPFRKVGNRRELFADWLFNSKEEYITVYVDGKVDVVKQYEEILRGERERFIIRTWSEDELEENVKKILKYLIVDLGIVFNSYMDFCKYCSENSLDRMRTKINKSIYEKYLKEVKGEVK